MPTPTISDDVSANFVSPGTGGSSVGNLTIGAGTVLVVAVVGSSSADPVDGASGGCKVGGIAMTAAFEAQGGAIYYLDDMTGLSGSEACLVYFNSGGYRAAATFYAVDHSGALEIIDSTDGSGYADNAPTLYTLPNMSGSTTDAISFGFAYNNGFFTGNIVLGGDLVEDHDHNIASERIKTYHDTTTPLGGHAYANGTGGTMFMGMSMFGPAPDPDVMFTPDAFGVEVGFQAGVAFGPGVDVMLFPAAFGVEVGFQAGVAFGATGNRQVMLTGNDIETPEMTAGGTEGQVLTYHESSPPTWEDATGGGGGSLRVREADSAPNVSPVDTIVVPNGSLTDLGGGDVQLTFAASIDWAEDADITTQAFGDAAAANAGTEAAPAGHRHGMPANPVTAHEAAGDPHPGYLTPTEGDAAYSALGHSHSGLPLDFGETADMSASAPGDTVAAGASGEISDAGHRHAREAWGGSGDIGASAPADAAAAGATGKVADAGHKHPRAGETFAIVAVIDGGGVVITTGHKLDIYCPFAFTIQGYTMLADPAGAIVIDIWNDSYGNYPPTNADSLNAGGGTKPTISATNSKSQDNTLTSWDTSVAADSTLRFNVDSVTSITRVSLTLKCVRV